MKRFSLILALTVIAEVVSFDLRSDGRAIRLRTSYNMMPRIR